MPRLSPGDVDILRNLADYCHLQSDHLRELLGRSEPVIRRRLRALRALGYAKDIEPPDERYGYRLWFLTRKGLDLALERGWLQRRLWAEDNRSNKNFRHELLLTEFHLAMKRAFAERLTWKQRDLYDRWAEGKFDRVNPDALFAITDGEREHWFFLELENSRQTKYRDKESNLLQKGRSYVGYYDSGGFQKKWGIDNFRVMLILPTPEKAKNICAKYREVGAGLERARFWITSQSEMLAVNGSIFITPKDFEDKRYSFADL